MAGQPTISVAIPTYNREQVLIETIDQVLAQNGFLKEIIIIDQTEKHDVSTERYLEEKASLNLLKYRRVPTPNLPAARNLALREATSDVLIFIDDDVILNEHFVESHLRNYQNDSTVVAVAGRIKQRLGWPPVNRPSTWRRCLDYRYFSLDSMKRCEGIATFVGCNHSIRVDVALSLGGYDATFEGIGLREETDMALRLFEADQKIVYDPTAELYHLAQPSGGCRHRNIYDYTAGKCLLYFVIKHFSTLRLNAFREFWKAFRLIVINKRTLKSPFLLAYMFAMYFNTLLRIIIAKSFS